MEKAIEIICIYRSSEGREVPFVCLVANNVDVMDEKDYHPSEFLGSMGGFSISLNQYDTIFSSTSFYVLMNATSFLLHSLYWIKEIESDWFTSDIGEQYPNDVVARIDGQSAIIRLTKSSHDISFSYNPLAKTEPKRGDRYVNELVLDKDAWYAAAWQALNEYFTVLLKTVELNPEDERTKILKGYYNEWEKLNNA